MSNESSDDLVSDLRGQRFEIMAENFNDVFWMFDADMTEVLYVNDEAERIYGIDSSTILEDPLKFLEGVHPEDRESVQKGLNRLSDGERINLEYRVNPRKDFEVWVDVQGVPVFNESGDVEVIIGSSREITQQKRAEEQLREEKNRMQTVVNLQNEVNQAGWNLDRITETVADRLRTLTRADGVAIQLVEDNQLIYRAANGFIADHKGRKIPVGNSLSGRAYRDAEIKRCRNISEDDRIHRETLRELDPQFESMLLKPLEYSDECFGIITLVYSEEEGFDRSAEDLLDLVAGILSASIAQAMQYLQKQEYLDQVMKMAQTDALTGLDNRRRFGEHLDRELERSRRYSHPLTFVILDLDHFKQVNDQYGHQKGDDVLQDVSRILRHGTRDTDETGRFGGEEFSVLLPETTAEKGRSLIERLLDQIRDIRFESDGERFGVTASAGVAELREDETEDDLIRRADEALYRAKSMGRDCVKIS